MHVVLMHIYTHVHHHKVLDFCIPLICYDLCFACGRFDELLYLAIRGSPNGFDDLCNHQPLPRAAFLPRAISTLRNLNSPKVQ